MTSFVDDLGVERFMGNIDPGTDTTRYSWTTYGDVPACPIIPRDQWDALVSDGVGPDDPFNSPAHDQDGIGMCFPAGSLVRMADGSHRPIEQVRVLEEVLTAEGNVRRVLRTMVRTHTEGLYRLHVWGHRHLRATAEHPILTRRGYVPLADVRPDDHVAIPKYLPETKSFLMPADYIEGRVYTRRSKVRRYAGVPGKPASVVVHHDLPDVVQLTADLGWVIGLYLAEGSTSHGKVVWVLSLNEADTHGAKLVRLLRECLGIEANVRLNPAQNTTIITAYGTRWAKLFEAWCAHGCAEKRLHPDLASGPRGFLDGALCGWTDGDGLGPNSNGGVTVSHHLALMMYDVANVQGKRPTIETLDVQTYGRVKTRRRRYVVRWGNSQSKNTGRSEQDDKHLWRAVDGVVREDFEGWVFNLEVEGDHSYVAEGVGVHNCNCSATAAALEDCRALAGLLPVRLSGGDLYRRISGGRDSGSLLEDGIREAMANGVASVGVVSYLDWRQRPSGAVEDAKRFRVLEAYLCPTFDHCFSAVLLGFRLITGILWHDNYTPGSDGWLPPGRGRSGGHAIKGYKPTRKGARYGIWHRNSWGPKWGIEGGCFVIPEGAYGSAIGGWWAVRAVVTEDQNTPLPEEG